MPRLHKGCVRPREAVLKIAPYPPTAGSAGRLRLDNGPGPDDVLPTSGAACVWLNPQALTWPARAKGLEAGPVEVRTRG